MCCLQVELLVRLRISHIISNRYLKLGNISASIGRMILDSHPTVHNKFVPVFSPAPWLLHSRTSHATFAGAEDTPTATPL